MPRGFTSGARDLAWSVGTLGSRTVRAGFLARLNCAELRNDAGVGRIFLSPAATAVRIPPSTSAAILDLMAGNKTGESKWITAGKLIELLSRLPPETMVAANDHYNLSLYEPGGMPEKYIGVIDIRAELFTPR